MTGNYALYRLAQWLNNGLPEGFCAWLAERLADLHWRRSPGDRAAVQSNLTVVLGSPIVEGSPLVREVFRNFARYLREFLGAHRCQPAVALEGYEHVANTVRLNQGGIILSAHVGNWELGAITLRRLGFRVSIVALQHRDPRVNRFFDSHRIHCGVGVVPLDVHATQRCLELLRHGHLLGVLGDREFGPNAITVSFFGRRTAVPRGPAILSLRTGAPVIPVFLIREGPRQFRFYFEPPIWPPEAPRTSVTVQQLTQTYVTVIERYLQRFPSQWLMFQPLFGEPTPGRANDELPIADFQSTQHRTSQ